MKTTIYVLSVVILLLSINSALALDECTGTIKYSDTPCSLLLPIANGYVSCISVNMTVFNVSSQIYNQSMLATSNPSLCNATFNITTPGTYTLQYTNGNFTDTGSIIVEGSGMEWLIYLAAALGLVLFIIAYLSRDKNILTLSGMMFMITGIILIATGFGSIQNVWTTSVGMIILGMGMIVVVVPNVEFIQRIMG
jgi:hypothetical protein